MNPPNDLETRLRASLRDNARHAPPDGPLAERILAELDAPVLRPHRSWRTWTFPLLAAAAIAAVALTLAGVGADRDTAAPAARVTRHASRSHSPSITAAADHAAAVPDRRRPFRCRSTRAGSPGSARSTRPTSAPTRSGRSGEPPARRACASRSCARPTRAARGDRVPVPAVCRRRRSVSPTRRPASSSAGTSWKHDGRRRALDARGRWRRGARDPRRDGHQGLAGQRGVFGSCLYNVNYQQLGSSGVDAEHGSVHPRLLGAADAHARCVVPGRPDEQPRLGGAARSALPIDGRRSVLATLVRAAPI